MRLYAKALRTLQDAISDESGCTEADVLCATRKFVRTIWDGQQLTRFNPNRAIELA